MGKKLKWDDPLVYELVELRRQQWDTLIWQIPLLTFTGQAFIFTILLGPDTTIWGRLAAGIVSVSVSYVGLLLLTTHRRAEEADADWLNHYEDVAGWPEEERQHGSAWVKRRAGILPGVRIATDPASAHGSKPRRTGWGRVPITRAYRTWVVAHYVIIAIAAAVTALAFLPSGPFTAAS